MSDPEKTAREFVSKMAHDVCVGIDMVMGADKTVAVAVQFNADGTIRLIDHKEFYADPPAPSFDLDLKAQDVTDHPTINIYEKRRIDAIAALGQDTNEDQIR